MIRTKRVYDKREKGDGFRILVDRLWPRGLSKEQARVDLWLREIAPSEGLRKWFSHEPKKWEEFRRRYKGELRHKPDLIQEVRQREKDEGTVTLLFSTKDEQHNNAIVLKDALKET